MKESFTLTFDWRIGFCFLLPTGAFACLGVYLGLVPLNHIETFGIFIMLFYSVPLVCSAFWCWKNNKRKLIFDEEGIKADKFSVAWTEVMECEYGADIRRRVLDRTLEVKTYDGRELSTWIAALRFDKYDLIGKINNLAGYEVFDFMKCVLNERHDKISRVCWLISIVLFMISYAIFLVYCTSESVPEAQNILAWCVIGALMCVATVGHYRYMQAWNRRNNYKD